MLALAVVAACGGPSVSAPAATAAGPATLLAAWAARTLPAGTTFSVDDARTGALVTPAGVDVVVEPPAAPRPGAADRYRIAADPTAGGAVRELTTDATDTTGTTGARGTVGVTAVPVARFGTGAAGLVVDRLVAADAPAAARAEADGLARRLAAGAGLLTNPEVDTAAGARAVLAAGGLDLRAAAVVAVLATTSRVELVEIVADPAETRAGRPARAVVLGGVSPGVVRAAAAATVGDYRPTITGVTTDTTSLLWNLTATTTLTGVRP